MRQEVLFIEVGLLQLSVDSLVFVSLTRLGMEIGVVNLAARLCGAAFGYVLNAMPHFLERCWAGGRCRLRYAFSCSWD